MGGKIVKGYKRVSQEKDPIGCELDDGELNVVVGGLGMFTDYEKHCTVCPVCGSTCAMYDVNGVRVWSNPFLSKCTKCGWMDKHEDWATYGGNPYD